MTESLNDVVGLREFNGGKTTSFCLRGNLNFEKPTKKFEPDQLRQ